MRKQWGCTCVNETLLSSHHHRGLTTMWTLFTCSLNWELRMEPVPDQQSLYPDGQHTLAFNVKCMPTVRPSYSDELCIARGFTDSQSRIIMKDSQWTTGMGNHTQERPWSSLCTVDKILGESFQLVCTWSYCLRCLRQRRCKFPQWCRTTRPRWMLSQAQ